MSVITGQSEMVIQKKMMDIELLFSRMIRSLTWTLDGPLYSGQKDHLIFSVQLSCSHPSVA